MFRILHLSDLHIQAKTAWSTAPILADALRVIKEQANRENVDVVAFSGDIAFSGTKEQYQLATEWLTALCLDPSGLNLDRKAVMFVPGNHDVDRTMISGAATAIENELTKAAQQADIAAQYCDGDSRSILMRRFHAYSSFAAEFGGADEFGELSWSRVFEHHGKRIRFDGLNSSWLCRGDDDHRRLLIGQPQLTEVCSAKDDCDVTIGMMHHPLADLMQHDEENTRNHVKNRFDLLLRGHLHRPDAVQFTYSQGEYIEIAAGALHEYHEAPNCFLIIDLTDDLAAVELRQFIWQGGQWILDRNRFQTHDGVGRITLPGTISATAAHSASRAGPQNTGTSAPKVFPEPAIFQDKDAAPSALEDALSQFPRFTQTPSRQDAATRHSLLEDVLAIARSGRDILIRRDPGTHHNGFLATVVEEFCREHPEAPAFHARCAGVTTGVQLQDTFSLLAGASLTHFAAALRSIGHAVLILDDLEPVSAAQQDGQMPIDDTIRALLDFCESLVVIRVTTKPYADSTALRIGALDAADTRAYLDSLQSVPKIQSPTDYARVYRVTGGLPVHLDALAEALEVTTLENALAQIDAESLSNRDVLPESVKHEITTLQTATELDFERIRRLLWTLSILERGETLTVVKRLDSKKPIWPKHASYLQKKGCLDVIEARPSHYGANPTRQLSTGEKVLRVPRMVRDFVVSIMTEVERLRLTEDAVSLYFGSDWKNGAVRMRRRIAFGNEMSSHQSGNEMTLLRALAMNAKQHFGDMNSSFFDMGLSYVSQLNSKGFYGEAYEAGREILGIAESGTSPLSDLQNQTLKRLLGGCARMIGERQACIDYLTEALPSIRETGEKSLLCDVLVDLALAMKNVGREQDAATLANEILQNTPRESPAYFQAKSILAEQEPDKREKLRKLKMLATRSRNLKHHTVADNIALEIASESDNTEEKLQMLSFVTSRNDREYNYVRATIRRVETLLAANRAHDITELDQRDLWRSYTLAYSQRLSGIFDWCHRVCWDYLQATGQPDKQAELLVFSSFVWRINGNAEAELKYMRELAGRETFDPLNQLGRFFSYCRSRLAALTR